MERKEMGNVGLLQRCCLFVKVINMSHKGVRHLKARSYVLSSNTSSPVPSFVSESIPGC